tara:strand:- start:329405 stop:329875 length:471 start_codon:yes stop_codon:yes gene_type:complete
MKYHWQTLSFEELDTQQLYALLQLRQFVFAVEQKSIYLDLDGRDQRSLHMLCHAGDQLIAYQRCLPPGLAYEESSLGRIVVAAAARGTGVGKELVERGIQHNLSRWPQAGLRISAQAYLRDFYAVLGFKTASDEYGEDGIPHIAMVYEGKQGSIRH